MKGKQFKIKEKVYHGTITPFENIDLSKGRSYKDFGKGFYLAYNKEQAVKMIGKKAKEAKGRKNTSINKTLYTYTTNSEIVDKLNIKVFTEANIEWLDFVLKCRHSKGTPHNYDIVIGPTADDDTTFCLNMYREGVYGPVDSIQAKRTLLNNLEVENYGTQMFIGTEAAKQILVHRDIERY